MDNSEHTRSGDYVPTRFSAQTDAVNLLAGAKTQAHPENTVGVLTMAGKTPQVLVTPSQDLGRVLNCMTEIDVQGQSNFSAAVQIAQLALKHRQNKNQRQRVVIFVASPIKEDRVSRVWRGGRGETGLFLRIQALPVNAQLLHAHIWHIAYDTFIKCACVHRHTLSSRHTHKHVRTNVQTRAHIHTHTNTHARAHKHNTHTNALQHTNTTDTRTHAYKHTLTHIQTQT